MNGVISGLSAPRPFRDLRTMKQMRGSSSRKGGKLMARTKSLRVLLAGESGVLESALREAGHEVDVGPDALSALGAAEAYSLDVVVIDLEGFEGEPFALAKAIRVASFGYKPLFVAMTRSQNEKVEARCRDAG